MIHPERDPDLLLLVHGVLSPRRTLVARWHLSRCLDCRRRFEHLQSVSQALAGAIRGPGMPRWPLPQVTLPLMAVVVWGLLAATLLVALVFGTLAVRGRLHPPSGVSAPAPTGPCRPDLPSDRCR